MTETELAAHCGRSQPEILANEGIIYLVRIAGSGLLKDAKGSNRVFKSATAAGIYLAGLGFERAEVLHQCAYDEVIGHEPLAAEDRYMATPMDLSGLKPLI
ncbi:MAG: DUF6482 family protein [Litorivicinus sp.]